MMINYNLLGRGRDTWSKNDVGDAYESPPTHRSKVARTTRLLYSLLFFMVFSGLSVMAQTVTIPAANTNTGSVRQPLCTYYGFERSAMIYKPSEIGMSGYISSVGFYVNSVSSPGDMVDVRIYMKHRSSGTFPSGGTTYATETTGATLVYGPVTLPASGLVAGAWYTIPLTTQFSYNNIDNLEVIFETSATGGGNESTGTSKQFRYSTVNNSFQSWNQDNSAPTSTGTRAGTRPNVQLLFAPPVPCSGTPAPGNTLASAATVCSGLTSALSLQNSTSGAGVTYQWQSSSDNVTYNDIASATSATYTATVTSSLWYRCNVTCSGNTGTSTPVQVTLNPYYNCYCKPNTSNGCTDGDVIARVTLNTLDNNSGTGCPSGAGGNGYSDYTTDPLLTTTLQAGSTYSCTVYAGQYSEGYAAWIDYNDDGVFNNVTERIGFSSGQVAGSGTVGVLGSSASFPIVLACNPPLGQHRLRVRCMYNISGSAVTPCTDNSYGEVEDYVITISAAVACPQPSALTQANVTGTSADLSWNIGCAETAWEVAVQPQGGGEPTGSGTPVSAMPYSVSGLTAGMVYEYYVRADCGAGSYSLWTGPHVFTAPACTSPVSPTDGQTDVAMTDGVVTITWNPTPGATSYDVYFSQAAGSTTPLGNIAATTVNITGVFNNTTYFWKIVPINDIGAASGCTETSFTTVGCFATNVPYSLNFNSLTPPAYPDCTSIENAGTGDNWGTVESPDDYGFDSNVLNYNYNSDNDANAWFYTNGINLNAGTSYRISYKYGNDSSDFYVESMKVAYGTSNSSAAMVNPIADYPTIDDATAHTASVDFTPPSTGVYYFGFNAYSIADQDNLYLDDISVTLSPTTISEFSPSSVCSNDSNTITLTGLGFTGATAVKINGVDVASFVVDSDTQITAVVNVGASTGTIEVTSPNGVGTSGTALTVFNNPTVMPISGGGVTLCAGDTANLSDGSPGGTWGSLDPLVATVDDDGVVTAVTSGSATITYSVTDNGCNTTVNTSIDVNAPIVSTNPANQTVVTGNNASYSVTASGSIVSYQWQVSTDGGDTFTDLSNDSTYSNVTTNAMTITATPSGLNGNYYQLVITPLAPCPVYTTAAAILNVGDTGIDTDPSNVSLCSTGTGQAVFTVVASGTVDTYAWEEDQGLGYATISDGTVGSVTYSGSGTDTLTVSGLTTANSGWTYRAVVTGPANGATSNPASLTVNQGIVINTNPAGATNCATGGSSVFSVAASGGITGYQWQYSTNGTTGWANVANGTPAGATYTNATTANLTVATTVATPAAGTYFYRAVVNASAPCSAAQSTAAQLMINSPAISSQPIATSVVGGATATFTVATSAPSPSYQWQYSTNGTTGWANVVNATPAGVTYTNANTATLSVVTSGSVVASNARYYRAVVTSGGCSTNSNAAQLTITNYCVPPVPTETAYYIDSFSTTGGVTNISNTSTGFAPSGYGSYTSQSASQYQGGMVNFSTVTGSSSFDTFGFSIWIDWNHNAVFDTNERVFNTTSYTASPAGSFTIPANATPGPTRMRILADYLTQNPNNPCAVALSFGDRDGEIEDYTFNVLFTPACSGAPVAGTVTSNVPSICVSGSATLTVSGYSTGVTGITFQWYNSSGLIASATSPTYTTPTISSAESYFVRVTCSDSGQSSDSNTITLNVDNPIVDSSSGATRCGPGPLTLTAAGSAGTTIKWYTDATGGSPVYTGDSYVIPNVPSTTTYYAEASSGDEVGNAGVTGNADSDNDLNLGNHGLQITTTAPNVKINSVQIPFTGTGTFTIAILDTDNTTVIASAVTASATGSGLTPVTVPLNLTIPDAGDYLLMITAVTGSIDNLGYKEGTYPYSALGGKFSITNGYWYGDDPDSMYLFNLTVSSSCTSPRIPVTATVDSPPSLALSGSGSTICAGETTGTVNITSNLGDFDNYEWTPATGVSGNSVDGYTFNPASTTIYTLNASQNAGSQCTNNTTYTVTVNPLPTALTIAPASSSSCLGTAQMLSASGGLIPQSNVTILSEDFNSGAPGWAVDNGASAADEANFAIVSAPLTYTTYFDNFSTVDGGSFYMANSDAGGEDSITDTRLVSPTFSIPAGFTTANLTFEHLYQYWSSADETVKLEISTDGGSTWGQLIDYIGDNVGDNTSGEQTTAPALVDLSAYIGQSNLKIRFNYVTSWGYYWVIDNIKIAGAGLGQGDVVWTPATGLYVDPAATTAYTAGAPALTVYAKPAASGTYNYSASVSYATSCATTSNIATINVSPTTVGGSVTGGTTVCGGSPSGLLTLSGNVGSVTRWEGSVSPFSVWTPIANTGSTYTSGALSQTTQFRAVVQSGACLEVASAPTTVTVNAVTLSSVTSAQVCANTEATVTLNGMVPNSTSMVGYTKTGVAQSPVSVTADASGVGTFNVLVTGAGQNVVITSITRTDVTPNCPLTPSSGNSVTFVLSTGCTVSQTCGVTLATIDAPLTANIVTAAQGYRWRITTMTGPTTGQVQLIDTPLRTMKIVNLATYAFATQYKVEVATLRSGLWGPFGTSCNVSTPAATTALTTCGQTLTTMSDIVYANIVPYAAGYRFRVTDPVTPSNTQTIDRPIREFRMNLVTAFAVQYGKTYNIEVAVRNTDGSYMAYGGVCQVSTPLFPTTSLQDSQCEDYAVPTTATPIYAVSYPAAIGYAFLVTGPGLPVAGVEVVKTVRTFNLSDFTGWAYGATYNVRVRLIFNTADPAGPYGKTCTIVTPGLSRPVDTKAGFSAVAYPNPFAEDFSIDVTTSADQDITVKVYDMTGRLLETDSVHATEVGSLKVGDRYPSGVYNVVVSQGGNVRTLRVIKR